MGMSCFLKPTNSSTLSPPYYLAYEIGTPLEALPRAMAAPTNQLVQLRKQSYQDHAEAVLRLAKTYLKDQAKAEDLTHDVFERLWRGNKYQEDKGSLRSYLLLMTRSMALNLLNQTRTAARYLNAGAESSKRKHHHLNRNFRPAIAPPSCSSIWQSSAASSA